MERLKSLSLLVLVLALIAMPAVAATSESQQGVQITSQVQGTIAGVGNVNIIFTGSGAHTLNGLSVLFTFKQLTASTSPVGPLTASLDPSRPSDGSLGSSTFPTTHKQNFFLLIKSSTLGNQVSDAPLTLAATIRSTPPTATYKSTSGNVVFYRQGDPSKTPVFTVQGVTSDVKPAVTQTVNITSRVSATVAGSRVNLTVIGTGSHLLNGTSVLFINKLLTASASPIGPISVSLDPSQNSAGTLSSTSFPADHTQSFFLQIDSQELGTLVADDPIVLSARIEKTPPTATYKSTSKAVSFYQKGDASKKTVLTIDGVDSDVSPQSAKAAASHRRLHGS
jgi:hypothetical protein